MESVRFETVHLAGVRDPFYEAAIEVRGLHADGERAGPRFHRDVDVRLELLFAVRWRGGEPVPVCYRSTARLVGLAAGEEKVVYFYLPPEIVERDRLSSSEPEQWRVSLAVGGQALPHRETAYSDTLHQAESARRFLRMIEEKSPRNDGILLPIYLTPFYSVASGRLERSPGYRFPPLLFRDGAAPEPRTSP